MTIPALECANYNNVVEIRYKIICSNCLVESEQEFIISVNKNGFMSPKAVPVDYGWHMLKDGVKCPSCVVLGVCLGQV